jgi:hypothetical protein
MLAAAVIGIAVGLTGSGITIFVCELVLKEEI